MWAPDLPRLHGASAVGHQCPECVRTGSRETRQLALPYGGQRVANPLIDSAVLIGINVAVWVVIMATGGNNSPLLHWLPLLPETSRATDASGQMTLVQGVNNGAVWQVFTWAGTGLGAYHGYKRNNSIGWGIGWGLLGGMFPLFTLPVAFAQGFGKRAGKK